MPRGRKKESTAKTKKDTTANLGFETKLWAAADALRNNMDAAEPTHVVLGLISQDDKGWRYGTPPSGKPYYAWVQRFINHLAPTGLAGFVLANGSISSNQSGDGEILRHRESERRLYDTSLPPNGPVVEYRCAVAAS